MPGTATPDKGKPPLVAQVSGYVAGMERAAERTSPDHIELEDGDGNRVTVPLAHYRRWKSAIDKSFRPVAEKKAAPAVVTPAPTGEQNKEN